MLNRGFTSHSQIILLLLYNAKFFDFYFLLKTKVLTFGLFFFLSKKKKIMGAQRSWGGPAGLGTNPYCFLFI